MGRKGSSVELSRPKSLKTARLHQVQITLARLNADTLGQMDVSHTVRGTGTLEIFHHTDQHYTGDGSDDQHTRAVVAWALEKKNRFVISTGDELDGRKGEFQHTIRSPFDYDTQMQLFGEDYLLPLRKRLLGLAGYYSSHVGWPFKTMVDLWRRMEKDYGVNVVRQRGRIRLGFSESDRSLTFQLTHDSGKSSDTSPLAGLRDQANEWSDDDPNKPRIYLCGHSHRKAIGVEMNPGSRPVFLSIGGTEKGNDENRPDRHAIIEMGGRVYDPSGNTMVVIRRDSTTDPMVIALPTRRRADKLVQALQTLDAIEKENLSGELRGQIYAQVEQAPLATFEPGKSRTTSEAHGANLREDEKGAPQYDQIHWGITSRLPIIIIPVANLRWGSDSAISHRLQLMENAINPALNERHSFVLGLRHWLDPSMASNPNRKELLDKLVSLFGPIADKHKLLCVMLSSSMMRKEWGKSVGDREDQESIMPGSYLSEKLSTPLVNHLSTIDLAITRSPTNLRTTQIVPIDRMTGASSRANPILSNRRAYDWLLSVKPDIIISGHTAKTAIQYVYDSHNPRTHHPLFISTGWFSHVDSFGKANIQDGAPGGTGTVICGENDVYSGITPDESRLIHQALWFHEGVMALGIKPDKIRRRKR